MSLDIGMRQEMIRDRLAVRMLDASTSQNMQLDLELTLDKALATFGKN